MTSLTIRPRAHVRGGVPVALLAAGLLGLLALDGHAPTLHHGTAASAPTTAAVPASARAAVSAALGSGDRAYWIRDGRLHNPAQDLAARVDGRGITLAGGRARVTMRLTGAGRATATRTRANRTTITHAGGIREWYANGPAGIEQGFDVARAPRATATGTLTLALATSGAERTSLRDGTVTFTTNNSSIRYSGLTATDARGLALPAHLALRPGHVLIRVDDRGARYPLHIDPAFTQTAELTASDSAQFRGFGSGVAFDGTTLAVGGGGGIYVFTSASGAWAQVAKLSTSTATTGGATSTSGVAGVAMSGDTIVAGGGSGKAYVWTKPAGGWADATESQVLTGSDAVNAGSFGGGVAIAGSTLLLSGTHAGGVGAVFVFTRSGGTWVQTQDLESGNSAPGGSYGTALAISGNQAVVAGSVGSTAQGSPVYLLTNSNGTWAQTATLSAGEASQSFGSSVAISGTTVAVGAAKQQFSDPQADPGAIYVFDTRSPGQRVARLYDPAIISFNGGNLGSNVTISGSTIVAGVANQPAQGQGIGVGPTSTNGTGLVDVWQMPASGWTDSFPDVTLRAPDGAPFATYGGAVALSGAALAVGSPGATVNGTTNAGRVYLYGGRSNALSASLTPNNVGTNDVFDLNLTVTDNGAASTPPIPLTFSPGTGLVQDDSVAAGGLVPQLLPIVGPLPAFPAALNAGQSTTHLIGFAINSPGTTHLSATVSGTDSDGILHKARAGVVISAEPRQPTRQDLDGLVAGSLIKLFDQAQAKRDKLAAKLADNVHEILAKHKATKYLATASSFDKALATEIHLPDNGLDFVTSSTVSGVPKKSYGLAGSLFVGLAEGGSEAVEKTVKHTLIVPFEYYKDFLLNPDGGSRVGMAMEYAKVVGDGLYTGAGYLGTAAKFYTSPAAMKDAWTQLPRIEDELSTKLDGFTTRVGNKIVAWDELMKKDPEAGVRQFGRLLGNVEGEVALFWAQNVLGANLTKSLKAFTSVNRAAGGAVDAEAELGAAATTTDVLDEAAAATPIAKTPQLGNLPARTTARLKQIVTDVSNKFGVKIELQARPINPLAAQIEGGVGKVEAVPTKNLTDDDILLGAPAKWNGQTAYYEPTRPPGFKDFEAPVQDRLNLRFDEKLKEYKQFTGELKDPTGKTAKVHKALKAGGDEISLGKNGKLVMELEKTVDEETGAILLRYKKLEVNGSAIFKGKPRPIVSDVDFNAVIDATTGRALPAGIRGQVELELMRQFGKAAKDGDLLFGFHGWTHSGFDIASNDFRYILKYMLMYMSDADAAKLAAKYAAKYGVKPSEFLDGYTKGKLLVKITPDSVSLGAGSGG